jgi:hypothetical protein
LRNPRKVITVPDAANSASVPEEARGAMPSTVPEVVADTTTEAVDPLASAIWEATVRFQMRS